MAKCQVTGKTTMYGRKISITRSQVSRRARSKQKPNVRKVKVMVGNTPCTMHVSSRALRAGLVTRA